jgi:hypothetical protein
LANFFIFFPESTLKKHLKSKIGILESLVDFKFNFEVQNLGLQIYKKAFSQYNTYGQRPIKMVANTFPNHSFSWGSKWWTHLLPVPELDIRLKYLNQNWLLGMKN